MLARFFSTSPQTTKSPTPVPALDGSEDFEFIEEKFDMAHDKRNILSNSKEEKTLEEEPQDEIYIDENYMDKVETKSVPSVKIKEDSLISIQPSTLSKQENSKPQTITEIKPEEIQNQPIKTITEDSKPQASALPTQNLTEQHIDEIRSKSKSKNEHFEQKRTQLLDTVNRSEPSSKDIVETKEIESKAVENIDFERKRSQLLGASSKPSNNNHEETSFCEPICGCLSNCFTGIKSSFQLWYKEATQKNNKNEESKQSIGMKAGR